MKTRTLASILIFILAVVIIAGSGTKKKRISDEDLTNAYTGTWINSDYVYKPKMVLYTGKWELYNMKREKPVCYGEIELMEKWIDSNGDIFFEYGWECMNHGTVGYELVKISDSGNTMERLYTEGRMRVEEWDLDSIYYTYRIYYRQEQLTTPRISSASCMAAFCVYCSVMLQCLHIW